MPKNTGRGSRIGHELKRVKMGLDTIEITPSPGDEEMVATQPIPRGMTMSWTVNAQNRPAAELLFDICLQCRERRRSCSCHERGYN